jgi:hypothetical protein
MNKTSHGSEENLNQVRESDLSMSCALCMGQALNRCVAKRKSGDNE